MPLTSEHHAELAAAVIACDQAEAAYTSAKARVEKALAAYQTPDIPVGTHALSQTCRVVVIRETADGPVGAQALPVLADVLAKVPSA